MPQVILHASPRGFSTGAIHRRHGDLSVTCAVLPKFWSRPAGQLAWPEGQDHVDLVLCETQSLTVDCADEARATMVRALTEDPNKLGPELDLKPQPDNAPANDAPELGGNGAAEALFALMLLQERSDPKAATAGRAGLEATRIFEPLAQMRLVHAVEQVIGDVRRGYVERVERLDALRGRVLTRSLAQTMASGAHSVVCRYEEFTIATPLLQVIATALDVAASRRWFAQAGAQCFQRRAIALRRDLVEVPSVSPRQAAAMARRIHLGPAQATWRPALAAATELLEHRFASPAGAVDLATDIRWRLDMSKVWEDILEAAFRRSGRRVDAQDPRPGPWRFRGEEASPTIRPDLIVTADGGYEVFDAKYSRAPTTTTGDAHGSVSVAHLYQMFAYAHAMAARRGCFPHQLGLLYCHAAGARTPSPLSADMVALTKGVGGLVANPEEPAPELVMTSLPFPRRKQVEGREAWGNYMAGLVNALGAALAVEGAQQGFA